MHPAVDDFQHHRRQAVTHTGTGDAIPRFNNEHRIVRGALDMGLLQIEELTGHPVQRAAGVQVDAGGSTTVDLSNVAAGTYEVVCTLHPQMEGALQVA